MQKNQKFKVWWDEKLGIGMNALIGKIDEETSLAFAEANRVLAAKYKTSLWLVDLTKNTGMDAKARQTFAKMSENLYAKKVAFFGASLVTRVAVSMVMAVSGKKDVIKHFSTKQKALEWLKKDEE